MEKPLSRNWMRNLIIGGGFYCQKVSNEYSKKDLT